jgi:hypothetical protein
MAKKAVDPLKAKQKKQKILAAVLGVLFLGLLAFQLPRVMKQLHPKPPPTASPSTTTTAAPPPGTPTLAAPTLQGSAPAATTPTTGSGSSLASNPVPQVQDNQLTSFSRFASKDPFAQQLSDSTMSSPRSSSSSPSASGASPTGLTPSSSGGSTGGSGQAPRPGSAVISVNGTLYTVPTGTDFPQASPSDSSIVPLFHLLSVTAHSAKISIVGGSYSSGAAAVTLRENKPVTLMNTADGTRYVLILKPLGTGVPTAKTTTTSTTTTVPVPPAAP